MSSSKVPQYAKFLSKSFKYAAVDVGKQLMPSVAETLSTNADILKTASSNIRSGKTNTKNIMNKIKQSAIGKDMNDIVKNSIDDIKTGNFYNKEREDKMFDDAMGGSDDFSFDSDSTSSGLDFNFDDGEEDDVVVVASGEAQVEATISSAKANIAATVNSAKGSAIAISGAVKTSAVANASTMIEYDREKTAMMIGQEIARHSEKIGLLTSLDSNVSKLVSFSSEALTNHITNSGKFFEDVANPIKEMAAMMKEDIEMKRNTYKFQMAQYETEERMKKTQDSKYDMSAMYGGGMDIGGYGKVLMRNFGDLKDSSGLGMLSGMGGDDSSFLKMFSGSPVSFLPKMLMMSMIPQAISGGMKKLNKTFGNLFASFTGKMNGMAESDNPIKSVIGKLLGVKDMRKDSLNLANYNKGIKSFDGISHKTLNEVIPQYLARIDAGINGGPAKIFDHKSGRFKTTDTIKKEFESETDSMLNSSVSTYKDDIMTGLQPFLDKMEDLGDVKSVREDVDSLLKHYVEKGKFFNIKDMKELSDVPIDMKSGDDGFNLIKSALQSTSYGDRMQFQDEINRYSHTKTKRLQGFETSDEYGAYRSLSNGLHGDVIGKANQSSNSSDSYLSKIYNRLTKGIITFQGGSIPGELTKEIGGLGIKAPVSNTSTRFISNPIDPDATNMRSLMSLSDDPKGIMEKMKSEHDKRNLRENKETFLSKKLRNSKLGNKLANSKLGKATGRLTDKITTTMDGIDKKTYETVYGKDDDDESDTNRTVKDRFDNLGDSIKDKMGNMKNGMGSIRLNIMESIKTHFGFIVPMMNKMILTPLSNAMFGEKGIFTKGKKFFNENVIEKGSKFMDGIKSKLFGGDKGGKGGVLSNAGFTPKSFSTSLGGLGASAILFKTGNPLLGMIGASASFISGSEKMKTSLFGKADKNGERQGGKISKETMNTMKLGLPRGLAGFVGGKLFGSLLLGPAGGAIAPYLAAGIGFASGSEKFKSSLFGEVGEDGERKGGKISKTQQKFLKGALPKGLLGMIGGKMAMSAMFPSFGIAAPLVGAMGGLSLGVFSQSEKFQKYMFGDEDPEDGKRKGGLVGNVKTFMTDKVLNPLKGWMGDTKVNMKEWFKDSIANPFKEALGPLKEQFSKLTDSMKDMFMHGWETVQTAVGGVFENSVSKPFGEIMEDKVLKPLKGFLSKLMGGLGKMAGGILSSPIKGLTSIALSLSGQDSDSKDKMAKENSDLINTLDSDSDKARTKYFGKISKKFGGMKNLFNSKLAESAGMMGVMNSTMSGMLGISLSDIKKGKFKDAKNTLKDKAKNAKDIAKGKLTNVKDIAKGKLANADISGKVMSAKDIAKGKLANANQLLRDADLLNKLKNAKDTTKEKVSDIKTTLNDKTSNARNVLNNNVNVKNKNKVNDSMTSKEKTRAFDIIRENMPKITGLLRKIEKEIHGQMDGVGHNLESIKNVLLTHLGPADKDAKTLDGKRGNKKRKGVVGKMLDIIKSPMIMAKDILMKPINMAKDKILGFGSSIGKVTKKLITLPLKFGKALGKTAELLTDATIATVKVVGEAGKQVTKTVGKAVYNLTDAVTKLPGMVIDVTGKLLSSAGELVSNMVKPLGGVVKNITTGFMEMTKVLPKLTKGLVDMTGMVIKGATNLMRGLGGIGLNTMAKIPGMDKVLNKRKEVYITGGTLNTVERVNGVKGVGPEFMENKTGYLSMKAKKLKDKRANSEISMASDIKQMTDNSNKSLKLMDGMKKGKSILEKLGVAGIAPIVVSALSLMGITGSVATGNDERAVTTAGRFALKLGKKASKFGDDAFKAGKKMLGKKGTTFIRKGIKGLSSKGGKLISMVKKLLMNPKVMNKIGGKKIVTKVINSALPKIIKRAGVAGAKIVGKVAALPLFILYDLSTGFAEAKRIFKVPKDAKVTMKMRIASGLGKCINGILLGLVEVGQSLLDPNDSDWITMLIYKAIANVEEENELDNMKAQMKKDTDKYNKEHGTELSVSEYNDEVNKSLFTKAMDIPNQMKALYGKGKDKAKALWSSAKGKLADGWKDVKGLTSDLKGYVVDKFSNTIETVTTTFVGVKDKFMETLTGLKDSIVDRFSGITDTIKALPKSISDKIGSTIDTLTTKVTEKIADIFNVGKDVKDKIVNKYNDTKDSVVSFYDRMKNNVSNTYNNTLDSVANTIQERSNRYKDRQSGVYGKGKGDVFYSQNDSRWGAKSFTVPGDNKSTTIGEAGCGPTTMAMAMSSITGRNITPDNAANYAAVGGYKEPNDGTNFQFFTDYAKTAGVTSKQVSLSNGNNIDSVLGSIRNGAKVILMGKDSSGSFTNPFGKTPHYILVTELDGDTIFIHDPLKTSGNTKYKTANVMKYATHAIILGEKSNNTASSVWESILKMIGGFKSRINGKDKPGNKFNGNLAWGGKTSKEFNSKVLKISKSLGVDPNHLMSVMAFESGGSFSSSKRNPVSGATGLIQFMKPTAKGLNTTQEELSKMSNIQQLDYVERYLRPYKNKISSGKLEDLYSSVLYPAALYRKDGYMFKRPSKEYEQNKGLDSNSDGSIDKYEAAIKIRAKLEEGMKYSANVSSDDMTEYGAGSFNFGDISKTLSNKSRASKDTLRKFKNISRDLDKVKYRNKSNDTKGSIKGISDIARSGGNLLSNTSRSTKSVARNYGVDVNTDGIDSIVKSTKSLTNDVSNTMRKVNSTNKSIDNMKGLSKDVIALTGASKVIDHVKSKSENTPVKSASKDSNISNRESKYDKIQVDILTKILETLLIISGNTEALNKLKSGGGMNSLIGNVGGERPNIAEINGGENVNSMLSIIANGNYS